MTHPEILEAERFGSRPMLNMFIGICEKCGDIVTSNNGEACKDNDGNIFCCEDCFKEYHGYKEIDYEAV